MVAIDRKDLGFGGTAGDSVVRPELELTPRAFQRIVTDHGPYVWRVLRSLGVREHDLEDVSQETFLIVHRQLPSFEGRAKLRTWIYGIALRVASDYRGKAYRRKELVSGDLPEQVHEAPQELSVDRRRAVECVDALLAELPEDRRQVFVLYEIEQLNMREVAEIVGCPLTTAYSRYYAARELISAGLARFAGESGESIKRGRP